MLKIDLAGNLTKADHLHNSAHDEEFEYDGAYRLTQYYKDADDEENKVSQDWYLDGVYNWTKPAYCTKEHCLTGLFFPLAVI